MTAPDTTMDARSWFENLPTGEDRAASMVVSDPVFVEMFVSMMCNGSSSSQQPSSSNTSTAHGGIDKNSNDSFPVSLLSCEAIQLKDIAKAYRIHSGTQFNSDSESNSNSSNTDVDTNTSSTTTLSTSSSSSSSSPAQMIQIQSKTTLTTGAGDTSTTCAKKEILKNIDCQVLGEQAEDRITNGEYVNDNAKRPGMVSASVQGTNMSSTKGNGNCQLELKSKSSNDNDNTMNIVNGDNVPVKEIVSTAFRIQHPEANIDNTTNSSSTSSITSNTTNDNIIASTIKSTSSAPNAAAPTMSIATATTTTTTTSSSTGEEKDETQSKEDTNTDTTLMLNNSKITNKTAGTGIITLSKASIANRNRIMNSSSMKSQGQSKSKSLTLSAPKFPRHLDSANGSKTNIIERDNDVDRGIHFSALSCITKTTTTNTTKNNNNTTPQDHDQEVSRVKRNGSLAFPSSSSSPSLRIHTKGDTSSSMNSTASVTASNILQHVCLVFTSALGMMTEKYKNTTSSNGNNNNNGNNTGGKSNHNNKNPNKSNNDSSSAKNYDKIELLTVDPLYLNKHARNGLEFLNDADQTIDAELKNLGLIPRDESFVPRFLNGEVSTQESLLQQDWLDHFTESEDTSIPAILVLLARVERSIRETHEQYTKGESKESQEVKSAAYDGKDKLHLVTPPPSPLREKSDSVEICHHKGKLSQSKGAATLENFLTPKEVESEEKDVSMATIPTQCKKHGNIDLNFLVSTEGQNSVKDADLFRTEVMGSWQQLKEKNSSEDTVKSMKDLIRGEMNKAPTQWHKDAEKALECFQLKDLLLVPICSVLLIRPPPSKLGVNQTKAYIELLVSEWSRIITVALAKVKNDIAADDLLSDPVLDSAVAKPGTGKNKKKKKRKNKKKKRKMAATANVDTSNEQTILAIVPCKETTKRVNEEGIKLKSSVNNDCNLSVMSSVSVGTEVSKIIPTGEITSVQAVSENDVTKPATNISKVNNINSGGVGGVQVEESDNQSSDGWETVEHKGGRSRRLANSTSKNNEKQSNDSPAVPLSPNSGRRNKGKAKSRQRTKQKAKEPRRIPENFEESIAKRGTTTTKAQMDERNKRPAEEIKKNVEVAKQTSARSSVADQNTAQTIPESLSGVSTAPVQTLVGPGNNNSASSSVASSLEAPHATRHKPRQHHDSCKEDDVGYHLLKVCERLSSDMNTFMRRRSTALEVRRSERGALLAALQDTVQTIWAGQCHVEMYGSCATQLDLPSSDLDVVIRGLDGSENLYMSQSGTNKSFDRERSSSVDVNSNSFDGQEQSASSPPTSSPNVSARPYLNYSQNYYQPLSANGNRVLRLAAELERQPWAVQVKAIPTASVPVIKILSDASRLPGAEWMVHHQQRAVAAAEMKMVGGMPHNPPNSYHNAKLQWRGADVMNDLLSLDITFEGPEHGGVGSTAYSAQVVKSVVSESGLPPDSTPAVQLLMVIKELLAQRRLNEPFSGGLSSYAILLLVVAVLKERHIIREEIERVERQQRAVSSESTTVKPEKKATLVKKSSWAAIAKKTSTSQNGSEIKNRTTGTDVKNNLVPKKPTVAQEDNTKVTNDEQSIAAQDSTLFPQGSNDVLEVLCSGEPTAGKLLMHFLLFYGRHFDATTTCIDASGTHHPEYNKIKNDSKRNWSAFIKRKPGGTYNPVTDMYTVEPLVVYDPLEGRESYNVTRSCYAWPTISWTFDQCFNTLSGVVELGSETNSNRRSREVNNGNEQSQPNGSSFSSLVSGSPQSTNTASNGVDSARNVENDGSLLLELLLSF